MHATATLVAVIAAAASAQAFAGTYPVVAWSRTSVSSLPELDTVAPSAASKTQQQRLEAARSTSDDLCQLDALYIVSAPGLHASDLARFPSIADSPNGMRAAVRNAHESAGNVQVVPYVSDRMAVAPVGKIVRRFLRCPGAERDVQFVRFDGLLGDEADTSASTEDDWRRTVLKKLDSNIARLVSEAPARSAFLVTDLPTSLSVNKRVKRQQLLPSDSSDETLEEMLEEIAQEEQVKSDAFDEMLAEIEGSTVPVAVPSQGAATDAEDDQVEAAVASIPSDDYASAVDPYSNGEWNGAVIDFSSEFKTGGNDSDGHNGTSIFQPEDGSGLLHRYALFSPALIVAVLVTFVILIPTTIVGAQALLSIETVNGLETKMTGSVGIDPSKQ
ncbi:hypothetical protein JCM3774_003232 [Rhodotorula dairenensis]